MPSPFLFFNRIIRALNVVALRRRSLVTSIGGLLLLIVVTGTGCHEESGTNIDDSEAADPSPFQFSSPKVARDKPEASRATLSPSIRFTEVAPKVGLSHTYRNGEQGRSIMVETTGGGCGWLDYDRDGRWDLFANQGGDPTRAADASQPTDALFRQLGEQEYQQVAASAFLVESGYSQGVAIGDYDNDGFDDVYVTNAGANTLWRNLGDGTFEELGESAGVNDNRWSTSSAWADLDADGDLDLYVCNYLQYDPMNPKECRSKKGSLRICHPRDLDAWPDECFMNQGDGTFLAEARQRGLFGDGNKGLGVAIADFNNDGLPDIYVANDTTANFLFLNQGEAHFKEDAYLLGCAVDRNGSFQASMGLGIADVDNNGFLDIYSSHFYQESNTLYENLGVQGFQDVTGLVGLHELTMPYLAFGVVVADFDQDSSQDIFVTNGHVENYPGNPLRKMHPQILASDGRDWHDYSSSAGAFFSGKYAGRGAAWCDMDSDGDADLTVVHQNEPIAILRNDSTRGHWLKFQFNGRHSNRRGIGCRVTVRADGTEFMQELCGGTSYACTNQPALIFGLGDHEGPCDVEILWPSGVRQHLDRVPVDREIFLDEPA